MTIDSTLAAVQRSATLLGVLAALVASLSVLSRTRLFRWLRWLWRRNVSEPLGGWFREQVRSEIAAHPAVGAVAAQIVELTERNDRQHAESATLIAELRLDVTRAVARTDQLVVAVMQVADRLTETVEGVTQRIADQNARIGRITGAE